jgi:transcriptional regulator with XRE-family HTH domain
VSHGQKTMNQRFGVNLRKLRLALALSQDEFADKCQIHRTYVGAIERGERNVTLATLERVAKSLNVDPLTLLKANE